MTLYRIKSDYSHKRLDKFIFDEITKNSKQLDISRNTIKNCIKNGLVKKNGSVFCNQAYAISPSDIFEIIIDSSSNNLAAKDIKLNIIYEDKYLAVIDKQAGLSTHPGAGNDSYTLANALVGIYGENLSDIGGEDRPGIVHRLDKDTSGLLVIAKNNSIHTNLKEQLERRVLKRKYYAVVWGNIVPSAGFIEGFITRHKTNRLKMVLDVSGRYSKTNYKTLERYLDVASLLECELDTGRTHQIRVHFSAKRRPLIGDRLYGGNTRKISNKVSLTQDSKEFIEKFPRQALHSKSISFLHPVTNKQMAFETELPWDMRQLVENLRGMEYR